MEVGLSSGDFVLDGTQPPPQKGGRALPNFWPIFIVAKQLDASRCMPLDMEVGLSPEDFVLDGDPAPYPKRGGALPKFSAHVYCGQTAAWIKVPLGTEVGLGRDDIVADGDPAPRPKKGWSSIPNFRPISIVAKRLDASKSHLVWR